MKGVGGSLTPGVPLEQVVPRVAGIDVPAGLGPEFAVGRVFMAVVKSVAPEGAVVLEVGGRQIQATTTVALAPGADYEFVVASRTPNVVLKPTQQPLPNLARALVEGVLGKAVPELTVALESLSKDVPKEPKLQEGLSRIAEVRQAMESGRVRPSELAEFHSRLGHDQEVRVLLSRAKRGLDLGMEMARLRDTLKAHALQILDRGGVQLDARAVEWAETLVAALGGLEAENAHRAESGAPQVVPLPLGQSDVLREARMFFQFEPDASSEEREDGSPRPFTIVLLLDLSVLGPLRVDLEVDGASVRASIQVASSDSGDLIQPDLVTLRADLEAEDLDVRRLALRVSPSGAIPVGDLLLPASPKDPSARVDVHA